LIYYFFDGKKVTKKANAKKAFPSGGLRRVAYFASFHCAKSAKPSFAAPKLRFFTKSQSASLASLVRSAAPTYAGFGVPQRKKLHFSNYFTL